MVVSEDGRLFVRRGRGVVAYSGDGSPLWTFAPPGKLPEVFGMALAADGTLYVKSSFLYALDRSGAVKWTVQSERTYTDADEFMSGPFVGDDGTVYVNSRYEQLYAINPDGRKKWQVHGDPRDGPEFGALFLTRDGRLLTQHGGYMIVGKGLATGGWPSPDGGQGRALALGGQ
jgi:outer membrane protein assembly factor BamB